MGYEAAYEAMTDRAVIQDAISPHKYAQWLEPGSNAWWVLKSSARPTGMESTLDGKLLPTIKEAFSHCRSGQNDVIFVLPGHTETIDSAFTTTTNKTLVAGTKIVGLGNSLESNAPLLTWNATGSTFAVDVADVTVANLAMTTSIDNVAEGFGVTGAGFKFLNNRVSVGLAGPLDFTIFIDLEAASDRALIAGNTMYGVTGAGSVITLSAAATGQKIAGNKITGVPTHVSTAGLINIAAACLDLSIEDNDLFATLANSTACILAADVAMTGTIRRNTYAIKAAGTATNGFVLAAGGSQLLVHFENYVSDTNVSGILSPAAT